MIVNKSDLKDEALYMEMQDIAGRLKLNNAKEALHFPRFLFIESVRICNSRCVFCAIDQWDKSVPFMSGELFNKIVEELSCYSEWIYQVNIQKDGEPLLDRKLPARIKRLKEINIKHINLCTNASLLDRSKAEELLKAGVDEVMISIDSLDKKRYEEMRPGLDYDTVLRNIKTFFKVRDEIKPDAIIRVRGICFEDQGRDYNMEVEHWEKFWEMLKKPNDRIYMKKPHTWGNQKKLDLNIRECETVYHPCIMPWSTMSISTDGSAAICMQDYDAKMKLGDMKEQSLKEIWNSTEYARVRDRHESGRRNEIEFCRGCKVFDPDHTLEKDRPELSELATIRNENRKQVK